MSPPLILLVALVLDAAVGEPPALWSRVPHPVVVMGRAVGWTERRFNNGAHRVAKGACATAGLGIAALAGGAAIAALPDAGLVELGLLAALLAQRSLTDHVGEVATALARSTRAARTAAARIVGRDLSAADSPAIARAAIESAAENLSDAVVAPVFWYLVLGLPGALLHKLVNTADSMIGYRTARHAAFGQAAARLDDGLNWIPARLTAALLAAVHGTFVAWPAIRRDARRHRSPNAGWPEAAMAAVTGVALAGPRSYGGKLEDHPFVNPAGDRRPGAAAIGTAIAAVWRVWWALVAATLVIAAL